MKHDKIIFNSNKLIAEFMGVDIIAATSAGLPRTHFDKKFKTFKSCQNFCYKLNGLKGKKYFPIHSHGEMKYHSSWEWLMPVVEKIERETKCVFRIESDVVICIYNHYKWLMGRADKGEYKKYVYSEIGCDIKDKKQATYLAVVDFIKYHNKKRKK